MKSVAVAAAAALMLSACATASQDIAASYVSPVQYSSMTCEQMAAEVNRVQVRAAELSGKQDRERQKDQAALAAGLILFAPAALFMIGGDHKGEIAQLKGQHNALRDAAAQKNCAVATAAS
jgi:hypothetical protein